LDGLKRPDIYSKVEGLVGQRLTESSISLSQGIKDRATLQKTLFDSPGGMLTDSLKGLEVCGFVTKHPEWSLKTGKNKQSVLYPLSDNYLRFYMHYIEPNLPKIEQGSFAEVPLSSLPGWEPIKE